LALVSLLLAALWSGNDTGAADGYMLQFNGRSSYVAVPALEPTAGADYTLEAICRPRAFRTSNVISWLGHDWMALFLADGRWGLGRLYAGEPHLWMAVEPAELHKLVHLAGVFRGSELQLYVDGRPVQVERSSFPLVETRGGLFIGGVSPDLLPPEQNDRFFDGEIDAVRISRGVRYRGDSTPPGAFESDAQTIAAFALDEGRGLETRSSDATQWMGQIVDAVWVTRTAGP
jgi:hypothetical protein